jgi:hypothetical protein
MKKAKTLIKKMTFPEAQQYCDNHPKWKLPNLLEAQTLSLHEAEHQLFWLVDKVQDRNLIYDKIRHTMKDSHPMFKHNVVLILKEQK